MRSLQLFTFLLTPVGLLQFHRPEQTFRGTGQYAFVMLDVGRYQSTFGNSAIGWLVVLGFAGRSVGDFAILAFDDASEVPADLEPIRAQRVSVSAERVGD